MKELLEALSVAMIDEGIELANTGGRTSSHDAATASMLKGFGRALADAAAKLPSCIHPATTMTSGEKGCKTATCDVCGMGLELDFNAKSRGWVERPTLSRK